MRKVGQSLSSIKWVDFLNDEGRKAFSALSIHGKILDRALMFHFNDSVFMKLI